MVKNVLIEYPRDVPMPNGTVTTKGTQYVVAEPDAVRYHPEAKIVSYEDGSAYEKPKTKKEREKAAEKDDAAKKEDVEADLAMREKADAEAEEIRRIRATPTLVQAQHSDASMAAVNKTTVVVPPLEEDEPEPKKVSAFKAD